MKYANSGLYDSQLPHGFYERLILNSWFYFEEILIFDTFITVPFETFSFKIYF